jgi:hypothetical protein
MCQTIIAGFRGRRRVAPLLSLSRKGMRKKETLATLIGP